MKLARIAALAALALAVGALAGVPVRHIDVQPFARSSVQRQSTKR